MTGKRIYAIAWRVLLAALSVLTLIGLSQPKPSTISDIHRLVRGSWTKLDVWLTFSDHLLFTQRWWGISEAQMKYRAELHDCRERYRNGTEPMPAFDGITVEEVLLEALLSAEAAAVSSSWSEVRSRIEVKMLSRWACYITTKGGTTCVAIPRPYVRALVCLGFLPVALLIFGVFKRRRRRRLGLCVHCGYDLRGAASDSCSECGTPVEMDATVARDVGSGGL